MDIPIKLHKKFNENKEIISIVGKPVIPEDILIDSCLMKGKITGVDYYDDTADVLLTDTSEQFYKIPIWMHTDRFRAKLYYNIPISKNAENIPRPFKMSAAFFDKYYDSSQKDVFVLVYNEKNDYGDIIKREALGITSFCDLTVEGQTTDYVLIVNNVLTGEPERNIYYNLVEQDLYKSCLTIDNECFVYYADDLYLPENATLPPLDDIDVITTANRYTHGIYACDHDSNNSCVENGQIVDHSCWNMGEVVYNVCGDEIPTLPTWIRSDTQYIFNDSKNSNFPANFDWCYVPDIKGSWIRYTYYGSQNINNLIGSSHQDVSFYIPYLTGGRLNSENIKYSHDGFDTIFELKIKMKCDYQKQSLYHSTALQWRHDKKNGNFIVECVDSSINANVSWSYDYDSSPYTEIMKSVDLMCFVPVRVSINDSILFAFKNIFCIFFTSFVLRTKKEEEGVVTYINYDLLDLVFATKEYKSEGNTGLNYNYLKNNLTAIVKEIINERGTGDSGYNHRFYLSMKKSIYNPKVESMIPLNSDLVGYRANFLRD